MSVVKRILELEALRAAPPVLVDIGASGRLHPKWRAIAPFAVCVAFEPVDDPGHAGRFRRMHSSGKLVAERAAPAVRFHVTRSPHCSSVLEPDREGVAGYALAPQFDVERTVELEAVDLPTVLRELGIARVDWFKTDSQGTDLRLLESLGDALIRRLLVVELEPGIIDAYRGEDKLHDVLRALEGRGFWMSQLDVKGSPRIRRELAERLPLVQSRTLRAALRPAPGWAEAEYFNDFHDEGVFGERELLLGIAFAFSRRHYGFALELAARGRDRFGTPAFERLERTALRRLRAGYLNAPLFALRRALAAR